MKQQDESSGKSMTALVDCNAFYASCERLFRPDLQDKPIIVLSNNDGCIVAMSREAKVLGLKRGSPYYKVRDIIQKSGTAVFSSNYTLYADLSRRIMNILKSLSHSVEVYSIDEAFISMDRKASTPNEAWIIGQHVEKCTGIPVTVGVAPTKTLAKIASRLAKKAGESVGYLSEPSIINEVLDQIDVRGIWGIGWQYSDYLHGKNIRTAGDLIRCEDWWIKKHLTIKGLHTVWELRGIPCIKMEEAPPDRKAIMVSRQFGRPVVQMEELIEAMADYSAEAVGKLRQQKSGACSFTFSLETNPHKKEDLQYFKSSVQTTEMPTSYLPEIISMGRKAIKKIYRPGFRYRRVGVMISGLQPHSGQQLELFRSPDPVKEAVMQSIDQVNKRFGRETVFPLVRGFDKAWQMKRDRLSPCYTTRFKDFPTVLAR